MARRMFNPLCIFIDRLHGILDSGFSYNLEIVGPVLDNRNFRGRVCKMQCKKERGTGNKLPIVYCFVATIQLLLLHIISCE